MILRFDTSLGRQNVRVDSPSGIVGALAQLADIDESECRTGMIPGLYESGVRYAVEPREDWRSPSAILTRGRVGLADCECLACWRVAELRASGADRDARPGLVPQGGRNFHAVVVRGNGSIEDPSALLGMRTRGPRVALRVDPSEDRFGKVARLRLRLADGSAIDSTGVGAVGALAVADAVRRASPYLARLTSVAPRALGFRPVFAVGAEDPQTALVRAAQEAVDDPSPENLTRTVNEARNAIESTGGDWEGFAKAAVTGACQAAAGPVGFGWLCDLIGPIWDAIAEAVTLTIYPVDEFMVWAGQTAGVSVEKTPYEETGGPKGGAWDLAQQAMMERGWFPVYLHDRDPRAVAAKLESFGWPPRSVWSKTFGDWYTADRTRGGILLRAEDMTRGGSSIKLAAARWGTPQDRAAVEALKPKARELLALFDVPGVGAVPRAIDSSLWGVAGIFPPVPGSTPPAWLVEKGGLSAAPFMPEVRPDTFAPPATTPPATTPPATTPPATTPPAAKTGDTPIVPAPVADFVAAFDALVPPGEIGDWLTLARLGKRLEAADRRSPFVRAARALVR